MKNRVEVLGLISAGMTNFSDQTVEWKIPSCPLWGLTPWRQRPHGGIARHSAWCSAHCLTRMHTQEQEVGREEVCSHYGCAQERQGDSEMLVHT